MFKFVYKNLDVSHKLGISSYPEDEYSKHVHYHYELIFVCKGDLEYSIDGDTHLLREGNIVLVHPGQIHFADVKNENNYERYVLKFSDSILPTFLNEKLSNFGSYFNGASKYSIMFKNFDDYFKNFESEEEKYSLFVCDIIKLCILLSNETSFSKNFKHTFIREVLNYIDDHICEDITLDKLSKVFLFSKSYISTEFKKYMRTTIMKYVRIKKIIYAHKLILNGEKKSIAARTVGFDEYSTFYRCYTQIIGKTTEESVDSLSPQLYLGD